MWRGLRMVTVRFTNLNIEKCVRVDCNYTVGDECHVHLEGPFKIIDVEISFDLILIFQMSFCRCFVPDVVYLQTDRSEYKNQDMV